MIMPESIKTKLFRWKLNYFPAFWATGAKLTYVSSDFLNVRLRLPLNLRTRNPVDTIFGGSMYAAVNPIYMVMLIEILGPDYIVWDKGATIRFKKPGRSTLFAEFILSREEIDTIRFELTQKPKIDRSYNVDLKDENGLIHATVEEVVHIRLRSERIESVAH